MTSKKLRIGVMGMPGTGKTDFAKALAQKLWIDDYFNSSYQPEWEIIDNYAQDMAKDLKLDIGSNSSYLPNMMISIERAKREQKAKIAGKHYITVGTDQDTIAYLAVMTSLYSQRPRTEQMEKLMMRTMYAAALLSFMMEDLFEYDYIFYCPIPERFKIANPTDLNSVEVYPEHLIWVDEALQESHRRWGVNPGQLTGTVDEKVEQALGIIDRLNNKSEVG